jgi:hypothetical protein
MLVAPDGILNFRARGILERLRGRAARTGEGS